MKIKENFLLKKVGGEFVVVPLRDNARDFNAIIKLSSTGAFLWNLLEKGADREDLIAAVTDKYDVDALTAAADIDRFLARLSENALLDED